MELDPLYCDVIVQRWVNLGEERKAVVAREGKEMDVTERFAARQEAA